MAMESTRDLLRIAPEDIAYVKFIFESYEEIGIIRTVDRKKAIIVLLAMSDFVDVAHEIIESLKRDILLAKFPGLPTWRTIGSCASWRSDDPRKSNWSGTVQDNCRQNFIFARLNSLKFHRSLHYIMAGTARKKSSLCSANSRAPASRPRNYSAAAVSNAATCRRSSTHCASSAMMAVWCGSRKITTPCRTGRISCAAASMPTPTATAF
jgi:hypothetical protein